MTSAKKTLRTPLITSIPPSMKRMGSDGKDIGECYLEKCIASWSENGFAPLSLNSIHEKHALVSPRMEVSFHFLPSDAMELIGKPLIWISELVDFICQNHSGPVVLTNSDILLDLGDCARHAITNLQPGECVIEKRIDITDPSLLYGTTYPLGFDFFAFHTDDLIRYKSHGMIFGQPWWDHHMAVFMLLLGLKKLSVPDLRIRHLKHVDRWDRKHWITIGSEYLRQIEELDNQYTFHDKRLESFCKLWATEKLKRQWITRLKSMIGIPPEHNPVIPHLEALSAANIGFIDLAGCDR